MREKKRELTPFPDREEEIEDMNKKQKIKQEFRNNIFQDSDKYYKESYLKRVRDLRKLTPEKSAEIVEELVTCQLGKEILKANKKQVNSRTLRRNKK